MEYVGIQTQQSRNNTKTAILLLLFPILILLLTLCLIYLFQQLEVEEEFVLSQMDRLRMALHTTFQATPFILSAVALWFIIAYFANASMIRKATGAVPLDRTDGKGLYNMVENLCMAQGMKMPKINIIYDDSMNAFASGIDERSYTITLTTGLVRILTNEEVEAVVAHELMHIRNKDVRLLITTIIFVGIFTFIAKLCVVMMITTSNLRINHKNAAQIKLVVILFWIVILLHSIVGYFVSLVLRFGISRSREYMADAGAAEMTKNPLALASALRKISEQSELPETFNSEASPLFIFKPAKSFFARLFSTHPPIEKRITVLEQF